MPEVNGHSYNLKDPDQREQYWIAVGTRDFAGRCISRVRYASREEAFEMGFDGQPMILELDDGSIMFASADEESNAPGQLMKACPKTGVSIGPVLY